jgi:hypothetical protein
LREVHALAEAACQAPDPVGAAVRAWTTAVKTRWQPVHAASPSPPADPAQRAQTAQTLLQQVRARGAQCVAHRDHPGHALAWRLWHFPGELLTGVRHPAVPPDTTAAERALRPLVVARTLSGGTRSSRGSATRHAYGPRLARRHLERLGPPAPRRISPPAAQFFTPNLNTYRRDATGRPDLLVV